MYNSILEEQLQETLDELEIQKRRERLLIEENQAILSALAAITSSHTKQDIFNALVPVLRRFIQFDDAVILSRSDKMRAYDVMLSTTQAYSLNKWDDNERFERCLAGEIITLYAPKTVEPYSTLNQVVKDQLGSVILLGISTETSQSVIQLIGNKKGQFNAQHKQALRRFTPLIQRALTDIAYKEQLQALVEQRTSELQSKYLEVRKARFEAERANRAKSDFLATMSHEVRTPLNAVLGLIDDLLCEDPNDECREKLMQIESSAELLLSMISDVLDLSQIESGTIKPDEKAFDIRDIVTSCVSGFESQAKEKGLQISVNTPEMPSIVSDPARISQILFNLISNAIKFSQDGDINLTTALKQNTLHITIEDRGIGIEPEVISKLFDPFFQADSSTTRQYGGTGLGLTISNRMAELLNGRIEVSSVPGSGSTFTVTIPVAVSQAPNQSQSTEVASARHQGMNILVVEDCPTNQKVVELLLNRLGCRVTLKSNGKEALDHLLHFRDYDLVVMDISMPVMDGITATQKIREAGIQMPIMALTAHTSEDDKNKCFEAGMDAFLAKPVRLKTLTNAITRLNR